MQNYSKFIDEVNQILRKRNEVAQSIEAQNNVIVGLIEELKSDSVSVETVSANVNNIAIFSKVLSIYEQRLCQLDYLLAEYSTLSMNRKNIDANTFSDLMKDFDKRKEFLLGPINFNTEDKKNKIFR